MPEAGSGFVTLVPSMSGFKKAAMPTIEATGDEGGAKAGEAAGKSFSAKFKSFITSGKGLLTGGIVAGATAAVKGLYNIGVTFDDVSDTIRTGTGATGKDLDGLVQVAKNVGTQVPTQFDKIGPVVADLNTRLGLSGSTLQTVASQYLQAGVILGQDVDINKTTAAFSAFGIQGAAVSGAMDDLFRVSQATGVGMNELASAAQTQGATMKNLGFSFTDTVSLMGSLDKAGVNSQAVMASMSRGLATLAKTGKDPQKAFQDVTAEVGKYVKAGETAKAVNAAADIFGTRGAAQFVAAVQSGKLSVDNLMASTGATGDTILGVADDTADLAESWQVLKNKALVAIQPVASKTFDLLSRGVKAAADGFGPLLAKAQSAGSGIVSALAPIGKSIMSSGMSLLQTIFTAAKPGIDALVSALGPFLQALMSILPALSPVHLIFKAIEPLLPQIGGMIGQLASVIGGALASVLNAVTPVLQAVGAALGQLMSFVTPLIASLLPPLASLIGQLAPLLTAVLGAVLPLVNAVASLLIPIIKALMPVIETTVGVIVTALNAVIGVASGLIEFITGVFSGDWSKAWDGIKKIFTSLWDGVKSYFSALWTQIKAIFTAAWNIFLAVWRVQINLVKAPFEAVWNGIKTFVTGIWNGLKDSATTIWNGIKNGITTSINAVKTTISNVIGDIKTAWDKIWNGLKSTATKVIDGVKNLASGIWDGVTSGLKRELNGAIRLLNSAIGFINSKLIDNANKVPFVNIPHIPTIPSLATGGVVSTPTLAMVGDAGRGDPEIVAPRSMLRDIIRQEVPRPAPTVMQTNHIYYPQGTPPAIEINRNLQEALVLAGAR